MSDTRANKVKVAEPVEEISPGGSLLEPAIESPAPTESTADILNVFMEVAEDLNSTLELEKVLDRVAQRVKKHVDSDTFAVLLLDPLGQELRFRYALGFTPDVIERWRFGLGQGLVGTVVTTGESLRVGDVTRDPRYINAAGDARSELAIPLKVGNRTIGVLDVQSRQPHHFTQFHQQILTHLAGHLANTIENARLYENLREQTRILSLLHEVSRQLTSILDRQELLRRVAQLVKRLVDYQLFCVMLWNEQTQLLEHAFSVALDERVDEKGGFPLGYGISGTAGALRQPIRVPNVHVDPRYVRSRAVHVHINSELAVPLIFKDRLVGVLDLESTSYNAFTEEHEQILMTLASTIAIALENARLYEKVREDEQRLQTDLTMAREIQRGLLPDEAPRVPGLDIAFAYEPARTIGGDIFDILSYGEGGVAIAVGDVAGKGAAAALYGSLAIGILRGHVVEHPCEPSEMLEELNRHLQQPRVESRFVALAFAVYDPKSKTLTVANSGFTRPRVLRGSKVEEIRVEGVPLGLLPGTKYEQKKVSLQVGDVIVFCSDGIHECIDQNEEEFGSARLEALLEELAAGTAREIAGGILRATDRYAAGNGHQDDRTVVVVKITPPKPSEKPISVPSFYPGGLARPVR